jgi:hypothetical protein
MISKFILKILNLIYSILKKIYFFLNRISWKYWILKGQPKVQDFYKFLLKKKFLLEKIFRYLRFLPRSRKARLRCYVKLRLFFIGFSKMCIFNKSNFILWINVIKFLYWW